MALTRRDFVTRAAALAALQSVGAYGLLDRLATAPARAAGGAASAEQHLMQGIQVVSSNGLDVIVPPLHHQVVTGRLRVAARAADLREAQHALERALTAIERRFAPTPSGLGVTVAWGPSYFRDFLPRLGSNGRFAGDARSYPNYLPIDQHASATARTTVRALLDAERFPSDPASTILEDNHVAVLLRSDSLANIKAGSRILFDDAGDLFDVTSVRRGFVGGGFGGGTSLPKQMATAAGIPGAELIPDDAELFMGFTSTQVKALGPQKIANLETIPSLTDQWPGGYFRYGTTMHLSHLFEDLEAWYKTFDYSSRAKHTFRATVNVPEGTQTVPEGPEQVEDATAVAQELADNKMVGHSSSLQPATRLGADLTDNYGTLNPRGTAIPQRADFNTLDNPFFWSSRPDVDRQSDQAAAGLHFVVFAPTSDAFHRGRRAMDGRYGTTSLGLDPRSRAAGFNSVLTTTHRQNYLVPPRAHRSFPLAELL